MASSYCALWYHVVFATKERRPWISAAIRPQLHAYLGGIIATAGGLCRVAGGIDDHVHLLLCLPQHVSIADTMRIIKTNSSRWSHRQWPNTLKHGWQDGYSGFTVSVSQLNRVESYILGQEAHHRSQSYGDELRQFLDRHGVPYHHDYLPV